MEQKELRCAMVKECTSPVAMLDKSGFVYCEHHGLQRRKTEPCRRLHLSELNRLKKGETIKRY